MMRATFQRRYHNFATCILFISITQMVQCLFLSQNMGCLIQTSRVRRDVKLPFFLSLHHNRQFRRIVEGKTLSLQNTNNKFLIA